MQSTHEEATLTQQNTSTTAEYRVVIIGGGFAGLQAAKQFCHQNIEVVLLDRRNHHLFQPLLYQVATAVLNPSEIASPIRAVFRGCNNILVRMAEARRIDRKRRIVATDIGEISYDFLVLAAGMVNNYYGNEDWADRTESLKSLDEALSIRRKVLRAFEQAERTDDPKLRERLLTFVVIGGGPTGVEMAGALKEISEQVMTDDYRKLKRDHCRVILLEGLPHLLPAFDPKLRDRAYRDLTKMGVEIELSNQVTSIENGRVETSKGLTYEAEVILWSAGVKATPLVESLGVELEKGGRVGVTPELHLPDDDRVFVVGDIAFLKQENGDPVPGLAPAAMQMGTHSARNILHRYRGEEMEPFRYRDKGQMATIGRARAVAESYGLKFGGFMAWMAWLVVHLYFLIGFRSRLITVFQWMWAYLFWSAGARLIVNEEKESSQS